MRFRTYKNTELTVSEVGFGMWTISTGWWGNFTEGEAVALMHKAFDLGVTLFDAAEALPVPMAFVAVTVNVYAVPLVRPVTVIGELAALPVKPPGLDVAV